MTRAISGMRRVSFIAMALALLTIVLAAIAVGPVSSSFMPHRHCLDSARHPWLLWITVGSDLAVAGAYFVVPTLLIGAAVKGYAPAPGLFYLFAAFILACGTTHVFDAWVMWEPVYFMHMVVKAITGVISWVTVLAIVQEARRALPAMVIVGRKLREAAEDLRRGDTTDANETVAEALDLIAKHLQRLQPPDETHV